MRDLVGNTAPVRIDVVSHAAFARVLEAKIRSEIVGDAAEVCLPAFARSSAIAASTGIEDVARGAPASSLTQTTRFARMRRPGDEPSLGCRCCARQP
jgi:hypothetical protein